MAKPFLVYIKVFACHYGKVQPSSVKIKLEGETTDLKSLLMYNLLILFVHFFGSGPLRWPSNPLVHWTKVQSLAAYILKQNVKGVSMATPGHRRGGQRTPPSIQMEQPKCDHVPE